jgi:hypothetical protein
MDAFSTDLPVIYPSTPGCLIFIQAGSVEWLAFGEWRSGRHLWLTLPCCRWDAVIKCGSSLANERCYPCASAEPTATPLFVSSFGSPSPGPGSVRERDHSMREGNLGNGTDQVPPSSTKLRHSALCGLLVMRRATRIVGEGLPRLVDLSEKSLKHRKQIESNEIADDRSHRPQDTYRVRPRAF